jgi:hypothetical protein
MTIKVMHGLGFLRDHCRLPYAMWVDGYDTLLQHGERTILERFDGSPVIAAERTLWPGDKGVVYPEGSSMFINAGGFMGRREDLIEIMSMVLAMAHGCGGNDQLAWHKFYLAHPEMVRLDEKRELFGNMSDGVSEPDSCVLHWSGRIGGRDEYWEQLKSRSCV